MRLITIDNDCYLLDDSYKGPLESFHASLEALSMLPARRRIAVLSEVDHISENVGDVYRNLGEQCDANCFSHEREAEYVVTSRFQLTSS